jgi:hypothetical protein
VTQEALALSADINRSLLIDSDVVNARMFAASGNVTKTGNIYQRRKICFVATSFNTETNLDSVSQ